MEDQIKPHSARRFVLTAFASGALSSLIVVGGVQVNWFEAFVIPPVLAIMLPALFAAYAKTRQFLAGLAASIGLALGLTFWFVCWRVGRIRHIDEWHMDAHPPPLRDTLNLVFYIWLFVLTIGFVIAGALALHTRFFGSSAALDEK
jgi:hypothetical protein